MRKLERIQSVKRLGIILCQQLSSQTRVCFHPWLFPSGVMASDRKELGEQLSFNGSPPLGEDGIFQVHWERGHCTDRKVIFLKILPLFTQGDTAARCPGESERSRGTKCLRSWGSEGGITGGFSSGSAGALRHILQEPAGSHLPSWALCCLKKPSAGLFVAQITELG